MSVSGFVCAYISEYVRLLKLYLYICIYIISHNHIRSTQISIYFCLSGHIFIEYMHIYIYMYVCVCVQEDHALVE